MMAAKLISIFTSEYDKGTVELPELQNKVLIFPTFGVQQYSSQTSQKET